MRPLLAVISQLQDQVRVVGTASSVLNGIDLPAGDVDILARDRPTVDTLARAAEDAGFVIEMAPAWLPPVQYFSRCYSGKVRVEFSTIEVEGRPEPLCWRHFTVVDLDGVSVRMEPSELRLATEVARNRPDRWIPIARHLARNGYDEDLLGPAIPAFAAFNEVLKLLAAAG